MIPLGVLASSYVAPAGGSFTPADLTGLTYWFDASDSSTVTTSGTEVTRWDDKSGNNYHLTISAGTGPAYTGTQNGLNVIAFDGANDRLLNATGLPVFGNTYTIMAVCTPSSGTDDYILQLRENGQADHGAIITKWASKAFEWYHSSPFTARATIATTATGFHLAAGIRDGATYTPRFDGAAGTAASGAGTDLGAAVLSVGAYTAASGNPSNWVEAQIAEIVITTTALSGTDLSGLESYLMTKWGIS